MDGSIGLLDHECKALLRAYRSGANVRVARRAHVVLLRAEGRTWKEIKQILFCSYDFISNTLKDFDAGGVAAIV